MTAFAASFYDALLDNPLTPYLGSVTDSPYLPMYQAVARLVPPLGEVVELGCGTGRLARMLIDDGHAYVGLDFAPRLLAEARLHAPEGDFREADLRTCEIPEAQAYVATEVLEHLDDDLALLGRLPVGATVVLSVPSFPSDSHVRHFPGRDDAEERYDPLLAFDHIEYVPIGGKGAYFHVMRGIRVP